jgi:hypothetical protein
VGIKTGFFPVAARKRSGVPMPASVRDLTMDAPGTMARDWRHDDDAFLSQYSAEFGALLQLNRETMTRYEEVMSALRDTRTIANHIANLGKIWARTEDQQLQILLGNVISTLQSVHASGVKAKAKGLTTPGNLINATYPAIRPLIQYCQSKIGAQQPEWQVLAERYGWTPPVNT